MLLLLHLRGLVLLEIVEAVLGVGYGDVRRLGIDLQVALHSEVFNLITYYLIITLHAEHWRHKSITVAITLPVVLLLLNQIIYE